MLPSSLRRKGLGGRKGVTVLAETAPVEKDDTDSGGNSRKWLRDWKLENLGHYVTPDFQSRETNLSQFGTTSPVLGTF